MIGTRLVLFDGIAGSGKTTTAQWLYLALRSIDVEAQWITEAQKDHPIFGPEIESARSVEDAIERAVAAWHRFAGSAGPGVTVMDGSVLDSPISFLLLQDTPPERIGRAVSDILAAAGALRPVLFHLYQADTDAAIEKIAARRGDGWREHLISYVAASPFARHRQLSGMEAPRAYYRTAREIADREFERLTIPKAAIDTSGDRWEAYRAQIRRHLDLPDVTGLDRPPVDVARLIGSYRDAEYARTWQVVVVDGALYLEGESRIKLLHLEGNRFLLQGWPVELTFEGTSPDGAARIHYSSKARDGLKSELTWLRVERQA